MSIAVLLMIVGIPLLIFHFWALVDVLRTPVSVWVKSDQYQALWGIVVLMPYLLGPFLYLFIARPRLIAAKG